MYDEITLRENFNLKYLLRIPLYTNYSDIIIMVLYNYSDTHDLL